MMDKNSRKAGTHELPWPLKDKQVTFPNNRFMTEKRLQHFQTRFIKNPDFSNDYKGFIEELIRRGYAEMSNKEAPVGRAWYIPHHGVYHPNKPGKICVVFDCSAEFKGASLN